MNLRQEILGRFFLLIQFLFAVMIIYIENADNKRYLVLS